MSLKKTIACNLFMAVRESGMASIDIAKKMGVSPGSVSNWIHGRTSIDIDHLVELCKILELSLDAVCELGVSEYIANGPGERGILIAYRHANESGRESARMFLEINNRSW